MGKIAFVFSGQGDQYPGMGKDIYEKYSSAQRIFALCDEIRPGTTEQCFNGSEAELKETKNTQPCLFAMELAAANVLLEKGVVPDAAAGFSLGEVTAATVSGVFDNETGFRLVCRRSELMQQEAEKFDTFMAAVIKLTDSQVKEICKNKPEIYPVNFNCPEQITVAGASSQMKELFKDIKEAGGRAIPLKVKGAFHSPFMSEAAKAFEEELRKAEIRERNILLYSNMTAAPYGDDVVSLLSAQICNPVQWEKIIENMIANGIDTFIEIGPGKTLTNMIKKISTDVNAVSMEEYIEEADIC